MEKLTLPFSHRSAHPNPNHKASILILARFFPALAAFALFPCFGQAAFDNGAWGVRAAGRGGAFVAQSDDGSAPFWNPAGSAFISRVQGSFMWERAYPGLTDVDIRSGYFSLIVPTDELGSMGGAVTSYSYGSLLSENIILAHYGRKVAPRIGLGINVKYLTHDYKMGRDPNFASNPVFANGTSAGNATFDLGALYRWTPRVALGLSGRNLTEPDVGLRATDRVPSEFQGGAAWTPVTPVDRWTFEFDLAYKNLNGQEFKSKMEALLGAEYKAWKTNRFGAIARMGLNRDFSADQKKAFKNITAGFTFESDLQNWLTLAVDYAFLLNVNLADGYSEINQSGTHQIGLSLLFGGPEGGTARIKSVPKPSSAAPPPSAPAAVPAAGKKNKSK